VSASVRLLLPSSHSTLYEWVADCERNGAVATLIVLAYLPHTGLDLLDRRYRAVRAQLPSQLTFSSSACVRWPNASPLLHGSICWFSRGPRPRTPQGQSRAEQG